MFPASKISMLQERAGMLASARSFFSHLGVIEVDTPLLSKSAPIDEHIEIFTVLDERGEKAFLHSSPEYAMKRLLSDPDCPDIYQLSHVFRKGEFGPLHNPEFTMVEWYRKGVSYDHFIEETLSFLRLFLGEKKVKVLSYREIFVAYLGIDYLTSSCDALVSLAQKHGIDVPPDANRWEKDTLLQLLMSFVIEPQLGKDELFVLRSYPATQSALAQVTEVDGEPIAERFEIYFQGIELANGYHELTDAKEQRRRLLESNAKRGKSGKDTLVIDEHFLHALGQGLPDCCGVAVGFDRLLMLKLKAISLHEILPFDWQLL